MSADTRPISQRTDAELVLQVLGTKGRPDPLLVEMARRLERRMADEEWAPVKRSLSDVLTDERHADCEWERRWIDVPAALRRQAG